MQRRPAVYARAPKRKEAMSEIEREANSVDRAWATEGVGSERKKHREEKDGNSSSEEDFWSDSEESSSGSSSHSEERNSRDHRRPPPPPPRSKKRTRGEQEDEATQHMGYSSDDGDFGSRGQAIVYREGAAAAPVDEEDCVGCKVALFSADIHRDRPAAAELLNIIRSVAPNASLAHVVKSIWHYYEANLRHTIEGDLGEWTMHSIKEHLTDHICDVGITIVIQCHEYKKIGAELKRHVAFRNSETGETSIDPKTLASLVKVNNACLKAQMVQTQKGFNFNPDLTPGNSRNGNQ